LEELLLDSWIEMSMIDFVGSVHKLHKKISQEFFEPFLSTFEKNQSKFAEKPTKKLLDETEVLNKNSQFKSKFSFIFKIQNFSVDIFVTRYLQCNGCFFDCKFFSFALGLLAMSVM
jgi:hypothetical protein